jgi:hypothetical protein
MTTKSRKWPVFVGAAVIAVVLCGTLLCVETVTESDETGIVRRDWRIRSRFSAPPDAPWWDDALNNPPDANQNATTRHRVVERHHTFGLIVTRHEIGVYRVGKPRVSHETP